MPTSSPRRWPTQASFGHAAADYAVGLGCRAGARTVVLFHHRPDRTDDALDGLVERFSALTGAGAAGPPTAWSCCAVRRADAIVVGSGPNGLAAAVTLARAGLVVDVIEGADTPGGGCRTQELTLPGFHHDVCSAVHPLLAASPFFGRRRSFGGGVKVLTPRVAFAHPLDGGDAAAVAGTSPRPRPPSARTAPAYVRTFASLVRHADGILPNFLAPLRSIPSDPIATAMFGIKGLSSAQRLASRSTPKRHERSWPGRRPTPCSRFTAPLSGAFGLLFTMLGACARMARGRRRQRAHRRCAGGRAGTVGRARHHRAMGAKAARPPAARG